MKNKLECDEIMKSVFDFTGKSAEEIADSKKRIEDFRKEMEEQQKVSLELLLKEITI